MLLFISFAPPKEPIRRLAESSPKANEPKKKRPEMPTSVKMVACYTSLIGATILPEVRAFSGIARASLKTISPKLSVALIFLWLLSYYQEKESDIKLGEQNMNKKKLIQTDSPY